MDKEAFFYQLESSIANDDKKLYAKTIYDLPTDLIVGSTKEEFSRIIYISHHFSSQKVDTLFNFLETKGSFFLNKALNGIYELDNSLLSKFYFSLYISLYETKKRDCEALKRFIEKIVQNNYSIIETIESAEVPEREKEEAKSKLLDFKKLSGILKEKMKSFSVDVAKDVVVSLTAE